MKMTKKRLLLQVAIDALEWGETYTCGIDDLLEDYIDDIERIYKVKRCLTEEEIEAAFNMTKEKEKALSEKERNEYYDAACDLEDQVANQWDELTNKIYEEAVELLKKMQRGRVKQRN